MVIQVPRKLVKTRLFGLLWVVIFAFLFSWFGYFMIFKTIYNLKPYQKLVFYLDTYSVLTEKPEQFKKLLNDEELKKQGLIDISYYTFDILGEDTPYIKDVIDQVDFAIIPQSALGNFTGIDDDLLDFSSLEDIPAQYELGYTNHAIKIYEAGNDEYNSKFLFSSWLTLNDDIHNSNFFLIASNYSKNFDKEKNHILGYSSLNIILNDNLTK